MKREDVIQLAVDAGFTLHTPIEHISKFKRLIELATQKAVAEERERLNWIERQDLEELSMGLVVDADHDGEYFVNGDDCVTYYGPTLREAIDNAIRARKDNT